MTIITVQTLENLPVQLQLTFNNGISIHLLRQMHKLMTNNCFEIFITPGVSGLIQNILINTLSAFHIKGAMTANTHVYIHYTHTNARAQANRLRWLSLVLSS